MLNKVIILIKNVINWYKVLIDKVFGGPNVIYKFRNGIQIECRTKSPDINEAVVVISGKEYPEEEVIIKNSTEPVVFDLGGNIGSFSIWFDFLNKTKPYKGFVFEPDLKNLSLLSNNLKLNSVSNFKIEKFAISGKSGVLKFDISGSPDAYKINNDATSNYIEVQSISLSEYSSINKISKIDILKMDIEGGEYSILKDDFDFIKNNVDTVLMEFHNLNMNENIDFINSIMSPYFNLRIFHQHKFAGILVAKNKNI
jgi:FkbM family methyltransferase